MWFQAYPISSTPKNPDQMFRWQKHGLQRRSRGSTTVLVLERKTNGNISACFTFLCGNIANIYIYRESYICIYRRGKKAWESHQVPLETPCVALTIRKPLVPVTVSWSCSNGKKKTSCVSLFTVAETDSRQFYQIWLFRCHRNMWRSCVSVIPTSQQWHLRRKTPRLLNTKCVES